MGWWSFKDTKRRFQSLQNISTKLSLMTRVSILSFTLTRFTVALSNSFHILMKIPHFFRLNLKEESSFWVTMPLPMITSLDRKEFSRHFANISWSFSNTKTTKLKSITKQSWQTSGKSSTRSWLTLFSLTIWCKTMHLKTLTTYHQVSLCLK